MSRSSKALPKAKRSWPAPAPSSPTATWSRRWTTRPEWSGNEFLGLGDPPPAAADDALYRAGGARTVELRPPCCEALPEHRSPDGGDHDSRYWCCPERARDAGDQAHRGCG